MANRISPCRMRVRDGEGAIKRADCTCVPENGEASSRRLGGRRGRAGRQRGQDWRNVPPAARKRHAFPLLAGEARQFSGAMTGPGQPPFDNKEQDDEPWGTLPYWRLVRPARHMPGAISGEGLAVGRSPLSPLLPGARCHHRCAGDLPRCYGCREKVGTKGTRHEHACHR